MRDRGIVSVEDVDFIAPLHLPQQYPRHQEGIVLGLPRYLIPHSRGDRIEFGVEDGIQQQTGVVRRIEDKVDKKGGKKDADDLFVLGNLWITVGRIVVGLYLVLVSQSSLP